MVWADFPDRVRSTRRGPYITYHGFSLIMGMPAFYAKHPYSPSDEEKGRPKPAVAYVDLPTVFPRVSMLDAQARANA
jgi:hypothetical protein